MLSLIAGLTIFSQNEATASKKDKTATSESTTILNDDEVIPAVVSTIPPVELQDINKEFKHLIDIYHAAQSGQGQNLKANEGIYFHKPILALVERTKETDNNNGYPKIIHEVDVSGTDTAFKFVLMLSSPEFRELCRERILKRDTEWLDEKKITREKIDVRRWPIRGLSIQAKGSQRSEIYGEFNNLKLRSLEDYYSFWLRIENSKVEAFKKLLGEGKIRFDISISYSNITESSGIVWITAAASISAAIEKFIKSDNIDENGLIFQDTINRLEQEIKTQISVTTIA
ncbi:MAG: hypothetical protein PHT54_04695, partial [Candidatus Nanoarchaeia archaeon]|nr:hypothetical protein [Candidatus Nanoarchaeia archaeon]